MAIGGSIFTVTLVIIQKWKYEKNDICSDWQQLSHYEIAKKVLEELKTEK